eukprot:Hpha_TRINITY_DN13864_c0_g2::TRINITY_DN13864_c0_g2_i2::g.69839::m.69839
MSDVPSRDGDEVGTPPPAAAPSLDKLYLDPCRWHRQLKQGRSIVVQCLECGQRQAQGAFFCQSQKCGSALRGFQVPGDVERSGPEETLWTTGPSAKVCCHRGCNHSFRENTSHLEAAFNLIQHGGTGRHHCRGCRDTFCDDHFKRDCMLIPETYGTLLVSACLACYAEYCSQAVRMVLLCHFPSDGEAPESLHALALVLAHLVDDWYERMDLNLPRVTLAVRRDDSPAVESPAKLLLCARDGKERELPREVLEDWDPKGTHSLKRVLNAVLSVPEEQPTPHDGGEAQSPAESPAVDGFLAVPIEQPPSPTGGGPLRLTARVAGKLNRASALALRTFLSQRYPAVELQVSDGPLFECPSCGRTQDRGENDCIHCGAPAPVQQTETAPGWLSMLPVAIKSVGIEDHFSVVTAEGLLVVEGPVSTPEKLEAFLSTVERLLSSRSGMRPVEDPKPEPHKRTPPLTPKVDTRYDRKREIAELTKTKVFWDAVATLQVLVPCRHAILRDEGEPPEACAVCGQKVERIEQVRTR